MTARDLLEQLQRTNGMKRNEPLTREAIKKDLPPSFRENALERMGGDESKADEFENENFELLEDADQKKPTPYEEPWTYQLMRGLAEQIETAANSILKPAPRLPTFGTLPLGQLNAMAFAVPDSTEHLIAFQHGVFGFANLLTKAVAASFPPKISGDGISFDADLPAIERALAADATPINRLDEFLGAYIVAGHPHAAQQYFLPQPFSYLAEIWLAGFELFIFGHELGHVAAGHLAALQAQLRNLQPNALEVPHPDWRLEFEADEIGQMLALKAVSERNVDLGLSYCGVDLVFSAIELVDRAVSTLLYGEVRPAPETETHPPASRRREVTRHHLSVFGEEQANAAVELASLLQQVLEAMWDRLEPRFEARHKEGIRPVPSWQ